mgnify:CR=1 FL=1
MSVRLEKILEAMENFKLNSDVALLENESLTPLVVAQSKKVLHESLGFIKNELTKGGVLEETQNLLRDAWTKAILEDIHVADYVPGMEDEGMGAGEMVGMGAGAAGLAAAGRYGVTGATRAYEAGKKIHDLGYGIKPTVVQAMRAGKMAAQGQAINDINAAKAAVAGAQQAVVNSAPVQAVVNNPVLSNPGLAVANAKANTEQAIRMAATDAARKTSAIAGKVRRVFK